MRKTFEQRLWGRIAFNDGCWEWLGSTSLGYGVIGFKGKGKRVHRVVYELLVGPIPEGLVLDHLCRNKACCRPDHLEPVTNRENTLRGIGLTALNAVKTHCSHGHEFNEENVCYRKGNPNERQCKTCRREWWQRNRGIGAAQGGET